MEFFVDKYIIEPSTTQRSKNMTKQQKFKLQQITNKLSHEDENMDFSIMEGGRGVLVFQASNANGPWYQTYKSLTAYIGKLGGVKVLASTHLSI
jgi:hypothetical protein